MTEWLFVLQVISIFGQPDNCTNACKEILQVMQQESTSNNRGFVLVLAHLFCCFFALRRLFRVATNLEYSGISLNMGKNQGNSQNSVQP